MNNSEIGKIYKHTNTGNSLYMPIEVLNTRNIKMFILHHTINSFWTNTTYVLSIENDGFKEQGYEEVA